MGSFSWLYCDQGKIKTDYSGYPYPRKGQRLISYSRACPASVLFPKEFGGKRAQIDVDRYDDYGQFGGEDIYCLVADWNRKWLSEHPEYKRPSDLAYERCYPGHSAKKISEYPWWPFYSDLSLSRKDVVRKWRESAPDGSCVEYRLIGINIACRDGDNAALPYPIKIAKNPNSVYEECPASYRDPYQGFSDESGYYDFEEGC